MTIIYRPFQHQDDYQGIADLLSAIYPELITSDTIRREEEALPPEARQSSLIATDEDGRIVGLERSIQFPWWPEYRGSLMVAVHPDHRRSGVGTYLYDHAERFVIANKLTEMFSRVTDDDAESLKFGEHRGWKIERHIFNSVLNVATFDEKPYIEAIESAQATGIRFVTMSDLGDTGENRRKLYDLFATVAGDVPGDIGVPDFEPYAAYAFDPAVYKPEHQNIALDGEKWVGLTWLMEDQENQSIVNGMTGVVNGYRGRHIALALKLLAIRAAKRANIPQMETNNDSENAPMLAINRKLGYVPKPGTYRLVKQF